MKRIVLIMVLIFALCACTTGKETQTPVPSPNSGVTDEAGEWVRIAAEPDMGKYDKMNKYEDCVYDITGDGNDDTIVVMTDAQKESNGEFMWDDSHAWAVLVESGEEIFVLCEEYMHGIIELAVSEKYLENGETLPLIRLMISSGSGMQIREYQYSNGEFIEKTVYNTGATNELSVTKY